MLVSFIIPVYKVENYLRECVDSVLKQEYQDLEIILVDDGSPDSCPSICDEYALKDNRVKVIHKKNEGLSAARNDGLNAACGEYVVFLDSDDYYSNPRFIKKMVAQIEASPVQILCHQRQTFIDGKSQALTSSSPYTKNELMEKDYGVLVKSLSAADRLDASACMKIINRSFLINNKLFFIKGIYSEDVDWFMRVLLVTESMAVTNDVAYCYRLRTTSISHNVKRKNIDDLFSSIENYANTYKQHSNEDLRLGVLNYLAYQFFITLGYTQSCLTGSERKTMKSRLKEYTWLCDYASNKKTKLCAFLYRFLGFNITSFIIGKYITAK